MKKFLFSIIVGCFATAANCQTVLTSANTIIEPNILYGLTNPLVTNGSPMTYYPADVNTKGAAFEIQYNNQGGTSFDGYPSGTVGAFKAGGVYHPANYSLCGMPVKIQNLNYYYRFDWDTYQINAQDTNDKWWATINVIFDSAAATLEPNPSARDYDLVIQHVSYAQDSLNDVPSTGNVVYWYFARDTQGNILPFTLFLNGHYYKYAVRYKFFNYPSGNPNAYQNDKVHTKFIPINNPDTIPFFDHPLKLFIDCTHDYLAYVPLTPSEQALANQKVANPSLWVKSIAAGYEVYDGNSTLANAYFFVKLDSIAPVAVANLTATQYMDSVQLDWTASNDSAFNSYRIYRSENNTPTILLKDSVRTNSWMDTIINPASNYKYYVTVLDRSFNESDSSNTVTVNSWTTVIDKLTSLSVMSVFPNPCVNELTIQFKGEADNLIKVFDVQGKELTNMIRISCVGTRVILNMENLSGGTYLIKGKSFAKIVVKR